VALGRVIVSFDSSFDSTDAANTGRAIATTQPAGTGARWNLTASGVRLFARDVLGTAEQILHQQRADAVVSASRER
jgi:hypothetical protein